MVREGSLIWWRDLSTLQVWQHPAQRKAQDPRLPLSSLSKMVLDRDRRRHAILKSWFANLASRSVSSVDQLERVVCPEVSTGSGNCSINSLAPS